MAGLIRAAHDLEVTTTPSTRTGEFSVWVDGTRVVNKVLPLLRPGDEKILAAVKEALRR